MDQTLLEAFGKLVEVVHELRVKCPWDREQTKESIRHLTIEEVYELSDAILREDWGDMKGEIGDLLLHVLFYSRIAEEDQQFSTTEMIDGIREKLIRRHPHIYGDVSADSSDKVIQNWEEIKLKEKNGKEKKSVLSGVPKGLPSLVAAHRIQEKVRNVGFDWEEAHQVWDKVKEEMEEFHVEAEAVRNNGGDKERLEKEFGDLIFSLVNYARFLDINPEDALAKTNLKFRNRFEFLEEKVSKQGKKLKDMNLAEMDVIWEESKKQFK